MADDREMQSGSGADSIDEIHGSVVYSVQFDCPQCGERLFVATTIDASGMHAEILRMRDMPSEDE